MTPKEQHAQMVARIKEVQAQAKAKAAEAFHKNGPPSPKIGDAPTKKKHKPTQAERAARREQDFPPMPDGTELTKTFLAGRGVWVFRLRVPIVRLPGTEAPFYAEFHHLHTSAHVGEQETVRKYHQWLKENPAK